MDALKFAFEILLVGALALPWLALLIRVFSPDGSGPIDVLQSFLPVVPGKHKDAVAAMVIIAIAYFLGSAVSRLSLNVVNDDELMQLLPTEDQIREAVYRDACLGPLGDPTSALGVPGSLM